jgi:hypothetical protein
MRVAAKQTSRAMLACASVLAVLGTSREEFLSRFCTTVGDTCYVPFRPGVPEPGWGLASQMCVLVHEYEHVRQHRDRPMWFWVRYLTSARARLDYEIAAYWTHMQMAAGLKKLTGTSWNREAFLLWLETQLIEQYRCRPQHVHDAVAVLRGRDEQDEAKWASSVRFCLAEL